MTSMVVLDSEWLAALNLFALENTLSKAILVSCTTAILYYSVLHFDEELEYIWIKKWTLAKAMYLLTRYSGAIFIIYAFMSALGLGWNDTGMTQGVLLANGTGMLAEGVNHREAYIKPKDLCLGGFLFIGPGTMIILLAEVILQIRVYALYERKKELLAPFVLLALSLLGLNLGLLQLEAERSSCVGTICNGTSSHRRDLLKETTVYHCLTDARSMSEFGWLVTAFTEFLLFILVLYKLQRTDKANSVEVPSLILDRPASSRDVFRTMVNGSVFYFGIISIICIIGTVLSFIVMAPIGSSDKSSYVHNFIASQMNAYQTIAITAMTILAPKLLISLRSEYYRSSEQGGTVKTNSSRSLSTWIVATPHLSQSTGSSGRSTPVGESREFLIT